MKNSLTCPKCQSRKLWRIGALKSCGEYGPQTVPVAYTIDFFTDDLAELEPDPERGIELIDSTPSRGGYR